MWGGFALGLEGPVGAEAFEEAFDLVSGDGADDSAHACPVWPFPVACCAGLLDGEVHGSVAGGEDEVVVLAEGDGFVDEAEPAGHFFAGEGEGGAEVAVLAADGAGGAGDVADGGAEAHSQGCAREGVEAVGGEGFVEGDFTEAEDVFEDELAKLGGDGVGVAFECFDDLVPGEGNPWRGDVFTGEAEHDE